MNIKGPKPRMASPSIVSFSFKERVCPAAASAVSPSFRGFLKPDAPHYHETRSRGKKNVDLQAIIR